MDIASCAFDVAILEPRKSKKALEIAVRIVKFTKKKGRTYLVLLLAYHLLRFPPSEARYDPRPALNNLKNRETNQQKDNDTSGASE